MVVKSGGVGVVFVACEDVNGGQGLLQRLGDEANGVRELRIWDAVKSSCGRLHNPFGEAMVYFVALLWPCRHALRGCKRPSTPQTTGATGQGPCRYKAAASPSPGAAFLGAVRVHGSRSRSRLVPVLARNRCISWHCRGPAVTLFVAARGPAHRRLPARPAKARPDTLHRPAQARVQPF